MQIVFRTDASLTIGTGHVMRCLTLASGLRERSVQAFFVCREHEGHLCDLIEEQGFAVIRLPAPTAGYQTDGTLTHAAWLGASWQEDAEQTRTTIEASDLKPDWLVVDHYALDQHWEGALRASVGRIMVIDDLADRVHDCDLLLDQNLVAQMHTRYAGNASVACGMLLGPEFALLQPIYAELHNRLPPREGPIRRIFIFFGGADSDNLTGRTLDAFLNLNRPDIEIDVVITIGGPHTAAVHKQVAGHDNIHLHSGLPALAPLMAKADLALGAAGATSWERLCLGLPALVVTLAENQRPIADALNHRGLIRWLGHQDAVDESAIGHALEKLIQQKLDEDWSLRCLEVVDGNGVNRVCAALAVVATTSLRVRHATLKDETLLLEWRNDQTARRNAFSPDPIPAESHRIWFRDRLRNLDGCRLYIVETTDGVALGQVRFEREDQSWEVHYALAPVFRGRGLGRRLLETSLLKLRAELRGALIFGQVKEDNHLSRNVFESLGFEAQPQRGRGGRWCISVCSDAGSWINATISQLLLGWLAEGHQVTWALDAADLLDGDICFYLSYGRIVDASILARHKNNLVVHASNLPQGRGWSPLTWQILEGKNRIPVALFEAAEAVDSGLIYRQAELEFSGLELIDELRGAVSRATQELCRYFVREYPTVVRTGIPQRGEPTYYARRRPKDSQFDVDRPLREQFNLLRTVDSKHYPAWFELENKRFALKVEKLDI